MWILKWIINALVVLLVIYFAIQNTEETATISFVQWETVNLPIWVIMFSSFAFGVLFWVFVSIFKVIGLKNENRKTKKEVKKLRDELNKLRNVSVEDSLVQLEDPKTAKTDITTAKKEE